MTDLAYPRVVVKLGTSTLTGGTTRLAPARIVELVRQMSRLMETGCEVLLVSSGAIAAGRERLGVPSVPSAILPRQMLAAVGQPRLMALYEQLFGLYGRTVGQVLLTRADFLRRRSYLNARSTLRALLDQGVVPIDNENLSALVANLVDADLLLLLTDQAGLFTGDPRRDPSARLLPEVSTPEIPEELWAAARPAAGTLGVGGMVTKLQAADLARRGGTTTIIAHGGEPEVVLRAARGEALGTRFPATGSALASRERFIWSGWDGQARLTIDAGAAAALAAGSSLLPVGVSGLAGGFERGDTVALYDEAGRELARGLVNYDAGDLARIRGQRSERIESILGYSYGDEAIHRNQLVLRHNHAGQ